MSDQKTDEAVILPVGIPGAVLPGGDGEPPQGFLRRGDDFHVLPLPRYLLWIASFRALPERDLLEHAESLLLPSPGELLQELEAQALLWRLTVDDRGREELSRLRIHLLCHGAEIQDGRAVPVRSGSEEQVGLGLPLFMLLMSGNQGHDLASLCRQAAEGQSQVSAIENQVLGALPDLVRSGLVQIDAQR